MNANNPRWPLYYSDTIHIGNLDSGNAILCLWTKKERIIDKLDGKNYSFIGQLYSKEYGLQILVRNLLANPHLRNLIVVGIDLNGSSDGLVNLFEKGVENHRIINTDVLLDDAITKEHVELLRKRVKLHDLRNLKDFEKLNELLENLNEDDNDGERIIIPLPKVSPPRRFPTDFSGFKARGASFYDAYIKLMAFMLRFGVYYPEKKKLVAKNITFFVKSFSVKDKKYLRSRKSSLKIKYAETMFYESIEAWDELKDIAKGLAGKDNICLMIAEIFLDEKNLEGAVEMLDLDRSKKWEPDPHGNIVIRVDHGVIKVIHVDQTGSVLDEFTGITAKGLYTKIAKEDRISMLYHALDIGAELQKAEDALKEEKRYVQDKSS